MMSLGANVRRLRGKRTQEFVAARARRDGIGCTFRSSWWCALERDKFKNCTTATLQNVAVGLGVPIDALFVDELGQPVQIDR